MQLLQPPREFRFLEDEDAPGGGYGNVYRVLDAKTGAPVPDWLYKEYHPKKTPTRAQQEHLERLIAKAPHEHHLWSAWPRSLSRRRDAERRPRVGVLMQAAPGEQLQALLAPSLRRECFKGATWGDLVVAALHLARAVARLHEAGVVHRDLKANNVLVDRNQNIVLIDCDGCAVLGHPHAPRSILYGEDYRAPEIRGGAAPTHEQDDFALAVLVFKLLFLNASPFRGERTIKGAEWLTDEEAIAQSQFAFTRARRHALTIRPPSGYPNLTLVTRELGDLFEKAFGPTHPFARPTADAFVRALEQQRRALAACWAFPKQHVYSQHVGDCPWCHPKLAHHFPGEGAGAPRPAPPPPSWPGPADLAIRLELPRGTGASWQGWPLE